MAVLLVYRRDLMSKTHLCRLFLAHHRCNSALRGENPRGPKFIGPDRILLSARIQIAGVVLTLSGVATVAALQAG